MADIIEDPERGLLWELRSPDQNYYYYQTADLPNIVLVPYEMLDERTIRIYPDDYRLEFDPGTEIVLGQRLLGQDVWLGPVGILGDSTSIPPPEEILGRFDNAILRSDLEDALGDIYTEDEVLEDFSIRLVE